MGSWLDVDPGLNSENDHGKGVFAAIRRDAESAFEGDGLSAVVLEDAGAERTKRLKRAHFRGCEGGVSI